MGDFEYDDEKNRTNIIKHEVDFDTACGIWEQKVVEFPDARFAYGEDRFLALGVVDDRILAVIYTWRGDRRRIISARKARKDEREHYYQEIARPAASEQD